MTERVHIDGLTPAHVALLKQVAGEAADLAVSEIALPTACPAFPAT